MAPQESKPERRPARGDRFATTHWSMVVLAGRKGSAEASRSLAVLCENYWFPLYAFVRRAGHTAEDAQDLTQEFFLRLLTKNSLAAADPQRGRFRSFLLGAMKHFLANQQRRQGAQKRGGRRPMLSLDFDSGEESLCTDRARGPFNARAAVRAALGPGLAGPRAGPAPRGVPRRGQVAPVRPSEAVPCRQLGKRAAILRLPGNWL